MHTFCAVAQPAIVPVGSVPMRLPCTTFPADPMIWTASPSWPAITLPAPRAVPPRVLSGALSTTTPLPKEVTAEVPEAARPTKLPATRLVEALLVKRMFSLPLAATRLLRGGRGTADGVGGEAIDQDALGVAHGGASRGVKADEVAGDDGGHDMVCMAKGIDVWLPIEVRVSGSI